LDNSLDALDEYIIDGTITRKKVSIELREGVSFSIHDGCGGVPESILDMTLGLSA
jgi:hypothetical protein